MCEAHGTVKFYLEREKNAPANHQEFAREAAEKLQAYEAAIFAMQNALAARVPQAAPHCRTCKCQNVQMYGPDGLMDAPRE